MRATSLLPFWACILLLQSYNNVGVQSQRNRPSSLLSAAALRDCQLHTSIMARLLLLYAVAATSAFVLPAPKRPALALQAKKGKKANKFKKTSGQPKQEKKKVQEERFDAATRQYMFTLALSLIHI